MRRALRAATLLTAAAVLASLAACATAPRGARAAFPTTTAAPRQHESVIMVEGMSSPASLVVDGYGVPRIHAHDLEDLAFAMGYAHARDRRFQMELLRMNAQGRLREFLGAKVPRAVMRLELFSRMLGLSEAAAADLRRLSPRERAFLEAYARGVNAATREEPRPVEFRLLHYSPEPWTPTDSLAILEMISFGFCKDWEQELVRMEIIVHQLKTGSTIQRALALWPPRYDLPPHLIGEKPAVDPFASIPPIAPELAQWLNQTYTSRGASTENRTASGELAEVDPLLEGLQMSFLSNNWAVDGHWTGTGRSAFAVDPHTPLSLPPFLYIVGFSVDSGDDRGFTVMGAGFPGLPVIPFGTNGKVAWGPTSNWADTTDLFVEKPAAGGSGFYETEKGAQPFAFRTETFRIRHGDQFSEEKRLVRSSRHGVIINDFIDRLPPDFPLLALARSQSIGSSFESMLGLYRAASVQEARDALEGVTAFVGNWVLADAHGHIGYAGPVALPLRRRALGTVPVPGWTGTYEWDGLVPAGELPGIIDPPQGYLATANNQVVQPESTGYPLNFEGDVPHRVKRILSVLAKGSDGSPVVEQMRALQTDGLDASLESLRPLLLRSLTPLAAHGDLVGAAARTLLGWDGRTDPASPAPTLYQSLLTVLMNALLAGEVAPGTLDFLRFYYNADPLFFGILEDPANPAWDDRRTGVRRSREQVVSDAFQQTVGRLLAAYGRDMQDWSWRAAAPVTLRHPLGSVFGFWSLNRGGIDPRGTASSIFMHKYSRADPVRFPVIYGPALRLIVDFADMSRSSISIPGGESGRPGTRHYDDILPLFEKGQGVGIEMGAAAFEGATELRIEFSPSLGK